MAKINGMGKKKKEKLHLKRFVVLSNELQSPKYGRSASGVARPMIIPSTDICESSYLELHYSNVWYWPASFFIHTLP